MSVTQEISKIFFSIISLETCMYYYNIFYDNCATIKQKSSITTAVLYDVWFAPQSTHHYSESLEKTSWVYEPAKKLLWNLKNNTSETSRLKRLPWLSAEIYYGETKVDDCSAWIGELHYRCYEGGLTLTTDVILQAWAEETAHKVNYADLSAYKFVVIDEMGEDKTYKLGDILQ